MQLLPEALIVCPNRETPFSAADKISVEIAYGKVINRGNLVEIGDPFDGNPSAVMRGNLVADANLPGGDPRSVMAV